MLGGTTVLLGTS